MQQIPRTLDPLTIEACAELCDQRAAELDEVIAKVPGTDAEKHLIAARENVRHVARLIRAQSGD